MGLHHRGSSCVCITLYAVCGNLYGATSKPGVPFWHHSGSREAAADERKLTPAQQPE